MPLPEEDAVPKQGEAVGRTARIVERIMVCFLALRTRAAAEPDGQTRICLDNLGHAIRATIEWCARAQHDEERLAKSPAIIAPQLTNQPQDRTPTALPYTTTAWWWHQL
nr:hypothetical protein OH820_25510 [Streptomyces sp. NBC_00857]